MSVALKIIDLGGGVTMNLCPIEMGGFCMGQRGVRVEEEPVHRVQIARPFWMGETAVTQEQFAVWTREHLSEQKNHFAGKPKHPAECMSWNEAVAFCRWLTAKLPPGWLAGLPTEAEWEYACRAGTTTQYHSGDGEEALKRVAWYGEDLSKGGTHAVGSKGAESANAFGLFDMHGNVWEWCYDRWDETAYRSRVDGACDPAAAERDAFFGPEGSRERSDDQPRVLRGGSWGNHATGCRSAIRFRYEPGDRDWDFGFRLVLVPGPQASQDEKSAASERSRRRRDDDGGGASRRSAGRKQGQRPAQRRIFLSEKPDIPSP